MTDATHTANPVAAEVEALVAEVAAVETPAVEAAEAPAAEVAPVDTTASEPEATFSTAVEPSDAPVENGDGAPAESGEAAATDEAQDAADESSPPGSAGSDKKNKSWISKLAGNIKKLTDKKPKTEKAAAAPAAGEAADAEATTVIADEGASEAPAAAETVEAVPAEEETAAATSEPSADATVADVSATEEKTSDLTVDAPAAHKLPKRYSFNIFKKKGDKKDAERKDDKAAPTTVSEGAAEAETEAEAPAPPSKDGAPVIETQIPAETAVEETAVATAH
ncbi:hypothetical protein BG004_006669 [Podila humilis]|nr:hypothetical protein BG004_006669 [Podila humilis]